MGSLADKVRNIADVKKALKEKFYINNTTAFADFIERMSKDETITLGVIYPDGNFYPSDFSGEFIRHGEPEAIEKLYSFKFNSAASLDEAEIVSSGADVFEKMQKIADAKLEIKEKFSIADDVAFADYPEAVSGDSNAVAGYLDPLQKFQALTFDGNVGKISTEPESHPVYTVKESNPPLTITNIGSEDATLTIATSYIGSSTYLYYMPIKVSYYKSDGTSGRWYYDPGTHFVAEDKITLKPGEFCRFRYYDDGKVEEDGENDSGHRWMLYFVSEGSSLEVSGDIMSMRRAEPIRGLMFNDLFRNMKNLVSAKNLILPPPKVANAYSHMFEGCTSLIEAPVLSPDVLTIWCYCSMFSGCTSLVNAPELPKVEMVPKFAFDSMFSGCTSLVDAPEIPAILSAGYAAYWNMFDGCTNLKTMKVNFTEWLWEWYYNPEGNKYDPAPVTQRWVEDIPAGGTFYKKSELPEDFGINYIPTGWTVVNFK